MKTTDEIVEDILGHFHGKGAVLDEKDDEFVSDLLKEQEEDIRLLTEEIEHLRADLDSLTPTKTDKQEV